MSQLLFTHHDNYNLHKILGFLCLFHYFIRFYWLIMYGTMYLQYNSIYTWATPICHLFLSLSSFIFHVPKTRFDSKIIIWKEKKIIRIGGICNKNKFAIENELQKMIDEL